MPFYIRDIGPESAWRGSREKLIGKEIDKINEICFCEIPFFEGTTVDMSNTPCKLLSIAYITISWEDYPSEECRKGLLTPPKIWRKVESNS